jgi:hypothetical protein
MLNLLTYYSLSNLITLLFYHGPGGGELLELLELLLTSVELLELLELLLTSVELLELLELLLTSVELLKLLELLLTSVELLELDEVSPKELLELEDSLELLDIPISACAIKYST